jgi:hypothetical protein
MDKNLSFTPSVALAIEQLRQNFPDCEFEVTPDGSGGAWFVLHKITLGAPYENEKIWAGGDLSAQLPYADLYPVFVSAELKRSDGNALGEAISQGQNFHGRGAVQISRRSNNRDARFENPAVKLKKVLSWLKSR